MASDWIKMRSDLSTVEEVVYLSSLLKCDVYAVVGRLHALWAWADRNSLDGSNLRVTFAWIDQYVSQKNFAENLKKVGWLKGKDGAISLPNFDKHNGETAKKRAETNLRVARHRETEKKRDGNKNVTQNTLQKALPDKNKRREETCISPETNTSKKTQDKKVLSGPLRKGSTLGESSVLPWGMGLPPDVTRAELLRIDEENCDADIRDLETGEIWLNFGPKWQKREPNLQAVEGGA